MVSSLPAEISKELRYEMGEAYINVGNEKETVVPLKEVEKLVDEFFDADSIEDEENRYVSSGNDELRPNQEILPTHPSPGESVLAFLSSLYLPLWLQHPVGSVQKGNDTHSPHSNLNFVEISGMIETLMAKLVESDDMDVFMICGIVNLWD